MSDAERRPIIRRLTVVDGDQPIHINDPRLIATNLEQLTEDVYWALLDADHKTFDRLTKAIKNMGALAEQAARTTEPE